MDNPRRCGHSSIVSLGLPPLTLVNRCDDRARISAAAIHNGN